MDEVIEIKDLNAKLNAPKLERNRAIYLDREKGMSWMDLVRKYGISSTSIRQKYYQERFKVMEEKYEGKQSIAQ